MFIQTHSISIVDQQPAALPRHGAEALSVFVQGGMRPQQDRCGR
jgi:hypothetical protein